MSDDWVLRYDGFDPGAESLREALCTLGNGYFAARGAAPESRADDVHYPGTYLAGGYNRLTTEIAGRSVENEDLVNLPNWLSLTFRIDGGDWFDLATAELLGYSQELDLRKGLLVRRAMFADQQGRRTRVAQRRLVHMQQLHVAGLQTTFLAENWSGELEIRSALDGRVVNGGVRRYRQLEGRHLQPLEQGAVGDEAVYLVAQTVQSRLVIAEAARTRVVGDGAVEPQARRLVAEPGLIGHELSVQITQDQPLTVEKIITLYSSRDHAIAEPGLEARTWIVRTDSFDELAASHVLAWDQLWRRFDVTISAGNHRAQMILRLHLFHLLQTVSPNTIGLD
ncbi:MAG TPA: hypothetical protein VML96_11805, partial [Egibacteraceae bacterium]|nr:hypothetical protein [Egibacteraceae bacterium]